MKGRGDRCDVQRVHHGREVVNQGGARVRRQVHAVWNYLSEFVDDPFSLREGIRPWAPEERSSPANPKAQDSTRERRRPLARVSRASRVSAANG